MKRPFSATVWREGDSFVSQCLDVDVASQGRTEEEALENLREALELHIEPPVATHPPAVRQIERGWGGLSLSASARSSAISNPRVLKKSARRGVT
jgi:hypothetical protein